MNRMPPPPFKSPTSGSKQSNLLKQALKHGHVGHVGSMSVGTVEEELVSVVVESTAEPYVAMPSYEEYWTNKQLLEVNGRGAFNVYVAGHKGPLVLCLHGAGYTGLTWSLLAAHLKDEYRVAAPDLRSHGLSFSVSDDDLSKEVLVQDIVELLKVLLNNDQFASPDGPLSVVLVGHSMGGGLAVWVAAALEAAGRSERLPLKLEGTVVIDVVEGTAIAALPHMISVLNSRPSSFRSIAAAVQWAKRTGMCKDDKAAAISLPSQLKQHEGDKSRWVWRTPLHSTQPFWEGWYRGLSEQFLGLRCPKMLVLAGTDRLDRTLTIGQMQGKFQLVLLPTAGHAVQEDQHEATAQRLLDFLKRFRVGQPVAAVPHAAAGVRPVLPIVAGPPV